MAFWNKGKVTVDQSNATIRVGHAQNVTAKQIGGTINNNYKPDGSVETTIEDEDPNPKSGRSIAIGVVNFTDLF